MQTFQNTAFDAVGVAAFTLGMKLIETDILAGAISFAAGLCFMLIKYYFRRSE